MAFDVDSGGLQVVRQILDTLADIGIPKSFVNVSTSGSKGFHIELFFDHLMYTDELKILYKYVVLKCELNPRLVEFRPTYGQAIKLPLSVHHKTGMLCWFYNTDTLTQIQSYEYVFAIKKISNEYIREIIKNVCAPYVKNCVVEPLNEKNEIENGVKYPGLLSDYSKENLPKLTEIGERHQMMLAVALIVPTKGMSANKIYKILMEWWNSQDHDLSKSQEEEIQNDARAIAEWAVGRQRVEDRRRYWYVEKSVLTDKDVIWILRHSRNRNVRRILFYLMSWCSGHKCCFTAYHRIGRIVGCSKACAVSVLKELADEKVVTPIAGEIRFNDGRFERRETCYLIYKPVEKSRRKVEIDVGRINKEFESIYFGTQVKLIGEEKMLEYFTDAEIKNYLSWKEVMGL